MRLIKDIKIEIQRWNFRRKQRKASSHDHDMMAKAILKANAITERTNKRFFVVKLSYSEYAIFTKQQVRTFFNRLGIKTNYMQCNEYIVHITKKPA